MLWLTNGYREINQCRMGIVLRSVGYGYRIVVGSRGFFFRPSREHLL